MTNLEPTIVVGVDGSRASSAAIRYAVHEAARLGARLRLVHVLRELVPVSPMFPLVPPDLEASGQALLTIAAEEARATDATVHVTTTLSHGPRVNALLKAASGADLIVLGHEEHASFDRLLTGSTVTPTAAVAPQPVVAVHPDWVPTEEHGRVLVGMKSTEQSSDMVRAGFELASQRHASLLLVHAWELPNEYDDLIVSRIDEADWVGRAAEAIHTSIEELRAGHTQVPVEVRVVHGQAAWVLREASAEVDLMLLGRRAHLLPTGHLGGTIRAALRHSECPVMVLPAEGTGQDLHLVLEQAGAVQK